MANTQVGVELVAEGTTGFLSSLQAAQGGLGNFSTALATMTTNMGGIATQSSALGSALATTLGIALYDVGKQIFSIGGQALDTVAKFERSTQSITAMYAVEMMRGTEVAQVTKGLTSLSEKEEKALRDKSLQYPLYKENVALASEALKKLKEQTGENTVQYEAATAKLQIAVNKMHDLGTEIDTLSNKAGKEVLGTKMVSAGDAITDVKEAFRAAQGPATAMIDDMTKLALISPFKREDTISTLKMAKGFGMTLEESGKLTTSLTKFATVTGRSGDHISRLAYAMGEMKSMDKVMMRQVRQMNLAGISVADMGEAFGITTKEMTDRIHDGSVKFDEFTGNMNKFIENKYGEAFKNIANSFVGLNNAVDDIKELGLAAIFEGPLKLYKPLLEAFVQPFTSGTLLESIRGFSIDLTKSFIPMFEDLAGGLTNVFARFETFASLIGGKGTVAVDKQETAMKDHQATIKGLGTSMTDLSKSGINMSDGFATLTLSSARVKASQDIVNTSLKENEETLKTLGTENGKLTAENSKYGDSMRKLAAAGKTNSDEFRALNTLVTDNKNKIGANKLEVDGLNKSNTDLNKEGKSLGETFGVLSGQMETATKKGQDKSKMYKDLVDQMAAEASTMGKNTDKYKEMAADLKVMDDNTKSYMDQIGKLTVAEAVAGEMSDQLKKLNDENKTMPWADAFLKANEDIMPVGSNLHTIFDTIFKIIKKVFDLFKSGSENDLGKTTAGAFSWFETLLGKVAKALKFVYDNFDLIITVIKNVVTVLGGLFAVGAAMGTIKKLITVVGLMLNPLNLVIAAVAILSVAWQKNWGGIQETFGPTVKKIKDKLKEITDWFTGVEPTVKAGLEPAASKFDAFREAIVGMVQKIEAVLIPLKNTFTNAFKGLFSQENIGLDKAEGSVVTFLQKLGVVPDEAVKIGVALKGKLAEWKTYFNFPELLAGFDTKNPAFQTLKTDIGSLFKVVFTGEQGEEVAQGFVDKVKAGFLSVFGDGEDKTGFAAAFGETFTKIIVDLGGYMDTFKEKLVAMRDKMIEVTKYVWKHRDSFAALAVTIGKVLIVLYLFNAANKLFGLTTVIPIAATAVSSLWTMGAALITWAGTVAASMGLVGTGATVAAGTFVEGMGTMTIGAGSALSGVGTMITAFLTSLGPVGWAIMAVIAVFFLMAITNFEGLGTKVAETAGILFATVGGIIKNIVQEVSKAFTDFWTNGLQPIWESQIKPTLKVVAELFLAIMAAVDLVIIVLGDIINYIVDIAVPIIETVFIAALVLLIAKFGGIYLVIMTVIRIVWALIKMIGRAIVQSGPWIVIVGAIKAAWKKLGDFFQGSEVAGFFDKLQSYIYAAIGWLKTWGDSIGWVEEKIASLYRTKSVSELLKDTPEFVYEARYGGLGGIHYIKNPDYIALMDKLKQEKETELYDIAKKTRDAPRGEFDGIYVNQYSGTATSAEGGLSGWLNSLLGGGEGDGGMAAILAKMNLDAPAEGVDPMYLTGNLPGVTDGEVGGIKTGYTLSPLMTSEQRIQAEEAVQRREYQRIAARDAATEKVLSDFRNAQSKPVPTVSQQNITIQGSYVAAYNKAMFGASGRLGGAPDYAALDAAKANRKQQLFNITAGLPMGASGMYSP